MSAVATVEHLSGDFLSPKTSPVHEDDDPLDDDLPQCKIKRNYSCNLCSFFSQNPRSFLYHSRDVHFDKIKIYECSQCLYASKHSQKLQRHINMIHVASKSRPRKAVAKKTIEKKEIKPLPYMLQPEVQLEVEEERVFTENEDLKCSVCVFTSRSPDLMRRHERVVHLKKRFLRCTKCSYVTHVKARYTKHVKYHSMPMIKCDLCDFRTPYKWNLDRHYKNHCGTGAFQCSKCNFRADIKQSLTVHEINHHVPAVGSGPTHSRRKRNMVGASETTAFESDGIDQDELELLRLEREDVDGFNKADALTDDEEPDLNAEDPIDIEPEKKQARKSIFQPVVATQPLSPPKPLKCKFCSYKSINSLDIQRHQKRIHGFVRDKRPPPNLIPIQGGPTSPILKIPEVRNKRQQVEESTPPVNEKEFKEMCKKSSLTSSLKEFVSLIGDVDGLKTIPDASDEELEEPSSPCDSLDNADTRKTQTDSLKRKNANFFDKLKEKLENGGNESRTLTCELCGYESKCLSESLAHEKRHKVDKDEIVLSGAELSSTRCQHCRQRCKTSQDLINHLMACRAFGAAYGNQEMEPSSEEGAINGSMENRVFVWNELPVDKKEESAEEVEEHNVDAGDELSLNSAGESAESVTPVLQAKPAARSASGVSSQSPSMKKVFKCPHCSFWASTASRFHVHIVGHLNKKPFECSLCSYRSNWRWDITKHIRLKSTRDPTHANATVNMTDETGRRNYSKYNKYLTMMKVHEANADSSGTGRRTRACEATQGTVSEEDILGPIPAPPQLTPAPAAVSGSKAPQGAPLRPPPPLQAAHSSSVSKRTLWKCKKCLYRNPNKDKVLAHVKSHYCVKSVVKKEPPVNEEEEEEDEEDYSSITDVLSKVSYKCGHCKQVSNWKHIIQRHCKLKHNGDVRIEAGKEIESDAEAPLTDVKPSKDADADGSSDDKDKHLGPFTCETCPYSTDTAGNLTAHKLNHVDRPGSIFKCTYCPFYVPSKIAVLEHMEVHGWAAVDECAAKIDSFEPNELYERPKGESEVEKRFQCLQCPYVSNSKTQFLYHKQFHRPRDAPFKCLYCSYNVSRRHLLHQHLRVHHNYKVADNEIGGEGDMPDIPLVWVNRNGTYLKMYKCRWCPHINIRRINIQEHEKMHKDSFKLHCPDCSYTCNNPGVLSSHVKVHTGFYGEIRSLVDPTRSDAEQIQNLQNCDPAEPEVVIKEEDKDSEPSTPESSYYQSNTLSEDKSQIDDANAKLIHFCNKCPARFLYKKELRIHSKFHIIRLPFKCEFCSYTARQRPHLLAHMKVHGQEYQERTASLVDTYMVDPEHSRPKTTVMPKESNSSSSLVWIVNSPVKAAVKEPEPKPKPQGKHACNRCPAKFFKPVALQYHLTLHGGIHQHRCKYCDYTVKTYGNLIKHQLVHENAEIKAGNPPPEIKTEVEDREKNAKKTDPQFGEMMHGSPEFIYPTYVKNGKLKEKRYKCHKCPSAFEKRDQYRIHLSLHGSKQKYKCEKCDYSVKYYANYVQHMKKHIHNDEARNAQYSPVKIEIDEEDCTDILMPPPLELTMIEKQTLLLERRRRKTAAVVERKSFFCYLCPYASSRKDCLENHEKRHFEISAVRHDFDCEHCDYSATQANVLREHIKLHFKPSCRHKAEAFLKADEVELWCTDENLTADIGHAIFKDNGGDGPERFAPVMIKEEEEEEEDICTKKKYINPVTWEPINDADDACDNQIMDGEFNPSLNDDDISAMVDEDLIEMIEEHLEPDKPKTKRLRGKNWRCKKCPHAFGKKDQFLRHIALHSSNQRYSCEICDYSVKFYTNYVQHMRMHQSHEPNRVIHIKQYVAGPDGGLLQSDESLVNFQEDPGVVKADVSSNDFIRDIDESKVKAEESDESVSSHKSIEGHNHTLHPNEITDESDNDLSE